MAPAGGSIGTMFVELSLDADRYTRGQQKLYKDATTTTLNIEENFRKLGIKSAAEFDLMRSKVTNAYNMIANSSKATADDIIRAEQAKNQKIRELNERQFGHQKTLLESLKNHWVAAGAAVVAAWKFGRMIQGWVRLADAQRVAENSLKQAMISNNRYSESAYQGMLKTASAMQSLTGVGDELTLSAQTILQRFDKIPNELLPRVTKAILNMGAATGNYANVARDLGRASEGMTETLRRQGIFLDEMVIKEKGFVGVLEEVEEKFGGQAEILAEGTGQWKVLGAAIGDAKEGLGEVFSEIATKSGVVSGLTSVVTLLGDSFKYLADQISTYDRIVERANNETKQNAEMTKVYLNQMAGYLDYIASKPTLAEQIFDPLAALTPSMPPSESKNLPATLGWANLPPTSLYTSITNELQQQDKIVTGMHPKTLLLTNDYTKQLDVIEKQRKEWQKTAKQIGNSFNDALVDSLDRGVDAFKDFANDIKKLFLKLWMDKAVTQPIIMPIVNQAAGMFGATGLGVSGATGGFSKFMGSSAFGTEGGATYGQLLGAGAVGYGMGGLGGGLGSAAGMFGGQALGSMAGTAVGGALGAALGSAIPVVGTVLGGMAGTYIGEMFESDPPKPKIDLLYDVIDGKVKLIGEEWENSPRSQELADQVQETLQTQIDFFKMLGTITDHTFQQGQVALSGRNAGGIFNALMSPGVTGLAEAYAIGGGEGVYAGFNKAFEEAWNLGFGKMTWENLAQTKFGRLGYAMGGTSGPEMLAQLQAEDYTGFEQWLGTGMGFYSGKDYNAYSPYATYWTPSGNAASMQELNKLLETYQEKLQAVADTAASGIGNAFLAALDSGAFETFGDSLRQNVFQSVKQGITQGLITESALSQALSTGLTTIIGATSQYAAGEITFDQAQQMINQSITGLDDAIAKMEPIMQPVYEWLQSLSAALDVNTVAVSSNTDAIMGPVNSFLMSLDAGPLAPSQSLAGLANIEDKLYTAALADPAKFAAYSSHMTQIGLPTAQGLTDDYAGYVAGVRSDVMGIPWVQSGMGSSSSAQSIGYEVGQALGPMLYDLQESGKITVNVVVDGQVVKSAVLDALSDRDVVATIQDM